MSTPPGRAEPACTYCGGWIEEGFLMDQVEGGAKPLRWIRGAVRYGIFGGAKTAWETKYESVAYRCVDCGHLELFVTNAGEPNNTDPLAT